MALPYKLIKNTNTKSPYVNQYYPKAVQMSTADIDQIAEQVQENCSLKKSDVKACIEELIVVLKSNLKNGVGVHLNGLGRFRLGIKGSHAKTEKAFSIADNVKGFRVNFAPDSHIVKGQTIVKNADGTSYIKSTRTAVNPLTEGVQLKLVMMKETSGTGTNTGSGTNQSGTGGGGGSDLPGSL